MRKVVFGFVWFVVFYFGICIVAGAVAGASAGDVDAARVAGEQLVSENLPLIIGASVTLAVGGAALGLLPGTRDRTHAV